MLIDIKQLFPKYGLRFKGVLHVGANEGEEATVYDELGINRQIWIEANPEIFQKLCQNISKYNPEEVVALNYCVGDENKDTVLHLSNNAGLSSSVLELGTHRDAHPDVHYVKDIPMKMHRIDAIDGIKELIMDCDLLNMDLQGFELQALRGMGDLLKQFKSAYLEVNQKELYKGCALIDSIDQFMIAAHFRRVETKWWSENAGWGDALYIKE
jgi:FkbM family methyltransferase